MITAFHCVKHSWTQNVYDDTYSVNKLLVQDVWCGNYKMTKCWEYNVFAEDDSNMDYVQNDKKFRIVSGFLFNLLTYKSTNVNNIQLLNRWL